jgi:hypothetical protein
MTYKVYTYDFNNSAESNTFLTREEVREFLTSVEYASKFEVEESGIEVEGVDWMNYSEVEEWANASKLSSANHKETTPKSLSESSQVVTLKEAAEMWNLNDSTLRRAISEGRLTARKSAGTWLVEIADMHKAYPQHHAWVTFCYEETSMQGYNYVAAPLQWQEGATDYRFIVSNLGGSAGKIGKMRPDDEAEQVEMLIEWYCD